LVAEALVWPLVIVLLEVIMQAGNTRLHRGVLFNVNVLILDLALKLFNEDVVKDAPTAVLDSF
jgi:hypothetical protein